MAKQEARLYRGQATQDVYAADDEIKPVIAVEVTHGDGVVANPNGEIGCRRESAVAPAKQDAHVPAVCIGHGQVLLSIAIEVTHGYSHGRLPYSVILREEIVRRGLQRTQEVKQEH